MLTLNFMFHSVSAEMDKTHAMSSVAALIKYLEVGGLILPRPTMIYNGDRITRSCS